MVENLLVMLQSFPQLLKGAIINLELLAGALALGFILGLPLALGHVYGTKYVAKAVSLYVWFFRGLPELVLLFLFYFGLFSLLGLNLSAFTSAVLVFGLRSAAYQSQIFRGGIQSLGEGQMLAARSIGMTNLQAIRTIIIPQVLRLSIPGWSNEYSIVLKDSAIAYAIGVIEMVTNGHFLTARTYKPMPVFLACGAIFLILTHTGVKVLDVLENKVRIPGLGGGRGEF